MERYGLDNDITDMQAKIRRNEEKIKELNSRRIEIQNEIDVLIKANRHFTRTVAALSDDKEEIRRRNRKPKEPVENV